MELALNGSGEVQLDVSGCSEKERILVGRKEIMVKFKKNGKPYKLTFHCVADGRIASHVRGRVSDIATPPSHAIYHYLIDQNKNITGLADYNGNMAAVWDYDAFGNVILQSGSASGLNPLGFSSEYRDEELGLIYYNYRHYNPRSGQWISKDTANDGANMYRMVGNNAVNAIDVLGLWKKDKEAKNFYCATSDTDNLKDLAQGITGREDDWTCLWPSLHTKDHGYASGKVKKDDLYTIENLVADEKEGISLELLLDSHLRGEVIFPNAELISPYAVAQKVKKTSHEGGSPIHYFVMIGHGGINEVMYRKVGKNLYEYFNLSDLLKLDQKETFERAIQKKGPLRCWFTKRAKAVFSGCNSQLMARPFADKILRKGGAVAQGTDTIIGHGGSTEDPRLYTRPIYKKGKNGQKVHTGWHNTKDPFWFSPHWIFFKGKK